jgi:hypothetical protein
MPKQPYAESQDASFDTEEIAQDAAPLNTVPAPPPTLDDAFRLLCEVLAAYHADESLSLSLQCDELQMIYANGNHAVAWSRLITILEAALGAPLRSL